MIFPLSHVDMWLMIFPLSHVDHVDNDLSAESCRSCGK